MRLATQYDSIHAAGAEVIHISVDDEIRQAANSRRWGLTHTKDLSDPGGEKFLKALDLYDPESRDGIAVPGMLVIDSEGDEVYRYRGRDFADRLDDEDLMTAVTALGLPPVEPEAWSPDVEIPDDLRGFFPTEMYGPYFRGNMFGAIALSLRVSDPESKRMVLEHRDMAESCLNAWAQWKDTITT